MKSVIIIIMGNIKSQKARHMQKHIGETLKSVEINCWLLNCSHLDECTNRWLKYTSNLLPLHMEQAFLMLEVPQD